MTHYLLISGASRGIGAAIAELFLQYDWQVINFSRSENKNPKIKNVVVDFTQLDQLQQKLLAITTNIKTAEKICLIHNTFDYQRDSIDQLNPEAFEKSLRVNLLAPNLFNQYLIPLMPVGSSIIYMGSTLATKAVPAAASYVIGKHALVGMMRATCQDLGPQGIHTCCVAPGFTDTEMLRQHVGADEKILQSIAARVGANRLIQTDEVARLVWFCANNPIINGAVIDAHLGQIEQ